MGDTFIKRVSELVFGVSPAVPASQGEQNRFQHNRAQIVVCGSQQDVPEEMCNQGKQGEVQKKCFKEYFDKLDKR